MKKHFIQGDIRGLDGSRRILLGQLNSNGDCLYATTIAKQIKKDYPGCHLTWAIGSMCQSIIDGNPDVDDVWVIPLTNIGEVGEVWRKFKKEALKKKEQGVFDEVFLTQIAPGNLHNYDGIIRSSIFRGYPHKITVPIAPVLRLSSSEIDNVRRFAEFHHLHQRKHVLLFETSPQSGQSFLTLDFVRETANKIVSTIPDSCVILSSNVSLYSNNEAIIDGSKLSLRETAELTKYCTLLIGGSSGISWICTSDWAKKLPMIQLLKTDAIWFNSFSNDHKEWDLSTDLIIEMQECSFNRVYQCIATVLLAGFDAAKLQYHEIIKTPLNYYQPLFNTLLKSKKLNKLIIYYVLNIKKHGFLPKLLLSPFLVFVHFFKKIVL